MKKKALPVGMLAMLLAFAAPVAVSAQDFNDGTILAQQAQGNITVVVTGWNPNTREEIIRTYSFPVTLNRWGSPIERDRMQAQNRARSLFQAQYPGFLITRTSWH